MTEFILAYGNSQIEATSLCRRSLCLASVIVSAIGIFFVHDVECTLVGVRKFAPDLKKNGSVDRLDTGDVPV